MLLDSKQKHFLDIMKNNAGNQQKLFKSMDKAIHRSAKQTLPEHTSAKVLANDFSHFSQDKVKKISDYFETISDDTFKYDTHNTCDFPALKLFKPLTDDEVGRILSKSASKSCELDPLPTSLLKRCIDQLCPIITSIVKKALVNAEMPAVFKQAIVRPLIKKPSLEPVLKNYRPVSNLSYVSKAVEEVASLQIAQHIEDNSLADPFQSAYKPKHSTETALLKVCNDNLTDLDNGKAVFLGMLDLSATFDTVDHESLLRRLGTQIQ